LSVFPGGERFDAECTEEADEPHLFLCLAKNEAKMGEIAGNWLVVVSILIQRLSRQTSFQAW